MHKTPPQDSKEDFAKRSDEIYERKIAPHLATEDGGKFVAIDIVSDDFEIDEDELIASDRLLARCPGAGYGCGASVPATHIDSAPGTDRRRSSIPVSRVH